MKLQIGKRYVLRDGRVTCPLYANGKASSYEAYPFAGDAGAGDLSWSADGAWAISCHNSDRDIVSEYAEPADPESRIAQLESALRDIQQLAAKGVTSYTYVSAILDRANAALKPAEPEPPTPEDGWLYYGLGPVKELSLHYTHEHIRYWNPYRKEWECGAGKAEDYQYAVKAGTQLAILCGLETLKLEAGKRYVLADGRVTGPLIKHSGCCLFIANIDDDYNMHCWNQFTGVYTTGGYSDNAPLNISHPYSE